MPKKIAVVSNLFPPHNIGGYEVGMSWMVDQWRDSGHDVTIFHLRETVVFANGGRKNYRHDMLAKGQVSLGSGFIGRPSSFSEKVHFKLALMVSWFTLQKAIGQLSRNYDVVVFGSPLGIPLNFLERVGKKLTRNGVDYRAFVSDQWVAGWPVADPLVSFRPPSLRKLSLAPFSMKRWSKFFWGHVLRRFSLLPPRKMMSFRPTVWICCSKYIRDLVAENCDQMSQIRVAHWNVPFSSRTPAAVSCGEPGACFAFGGQALPHKGIHQLLDALEKTDNCHLHIFSDLGQPNSITQERIEDRGVRVLNHGLLSPAGFFDFLDSTKPHVVVPSQWDEPFSIIAVQAVVAGCQLTITPTGGSKEWPDLDSRVKLTDDLTSEAIAEAIARRPAPSSSKIFRNDFRKFAEQIIG